MFVNDELKVEYSHKNVFEISKEFANNREKYKKNNYIHQNMSFIQIRIL